MIINLAGDAMKRGILLLVLFSCIISMGCASRYQKSGGTLNDDDEFQKRISGLTVQRLDGEPVELESLWKDRRIVLTFFRQFG
jgi:hypothetical protein